jgi:hypothetical protein
MAQPLPYVNGIETKEAAEDLGEGEAEVRDEPLDREVLRSSRERRL